MKMEVHIENYIDNDIIGIEVNYPLYVPKLDGIHLRA